MAAPKGNQPIRLKGTTMMDDIPEYKQMRRGLMALRLEAHPSVVNDMLALCEKAVHAAYEAGQADERQHLAQGST